MSSTVVYKGETLTTVDNETKTLETAGTWLEDDIEITDVSSGGGNLQPNKSVAYNPTEAPYIDRVYPDPGYDGMERVEVEVRAVPANYVGSGVPRKSSSDLTTSGATVTAPSGYYANAATATVASGTEGTPVATKGTVSNHSVSVTPSVTNTEGYISGGTRTGTAVSVSASELVSGTKSISANGNGIDVTEYAAVDVSVPTGTPRTSSDITVSGATVTVPAGLYSAAATKTVASGTEGTPTATKGAVSNHSVSVTPSVTNAEGYISGGTHNGTAVSVSASELVSGTKSITSNGNNIDVTNYAAVDVAVPSQAPTLETKSVSYTPTETVQTDQLTPSAGYDGFDEVNVTVGAIDSNYVGSNVPRRSSANLTVIGNTVAAASGYYANGASTTIMTGSMSVSATKGTVSNHAVTVTPKAAVDNAGYFATGDRTGTAISVSASELVSGTKSITQNGTGIDVANYETVDVSVSGGTVQTDTKTVTASNYPTSLSFTGMNGEPKMFTLRLDTGVSSSGSTSYYFIVDITSYGTTTHGNCFRIGSTRRVDTITSGYSWSYSGTTLTITSSAASRSYSPGAFYNGSYELMYVY